MFLTWLLACSVDGDSAEAAPVTCDEGAALLADVCSTEGVSIDVSAEAADCATRSAEWQDCWLECVFQEREAGCDPEMLACADDCVTG